MSNDQNFDDIKIKPNALDICIEAFTILVCAATWGFLIFQFVFQEILAGVFRLPPILSYVFHVLTYVFYAVMNYCVFAVFTKKRYLKKSLCKLIKITKENAERQYRLHTRINRLTRLCFMVFFSCLVIDMNWLITTDMTHAWFNPIVYYVICGILYATIFLYYYIQAWKLR